MPSVSGFRAVALDFDGTIARNDVIDATVEAVLRDIRQLGWVHPVLVSGRTRTELRRVLPQAFDLFDLVVAEDGAVLMSASEDLLLAEPLPGTLSARLCELGVAHHRGDVLIGTDAANEHKVLDAVRELGLDCQLVVNRQALMVLPAGVTKGAGLRAALSRLGLSAHSTIGIGDAENDLSLLATCELGVAVGEAVPSLRRAADVALPGGGPPAVATFLRTTFVDGTPLAVPARRKIPIGATADGAPVTLPAFGANVVITGRSGSGKSFLAGLFVEQLVAQSYSVLVLDPEGDYVTLADGNRLVAVGEPDLPAPREVLSLLRFRQGSVVVDLSLSKPEQVDRCLAGLADYLEVQRRACGLPHWVVIDEAHRPLGPHGPSRPFLHLERGGYCLITYRPSELDQQTVAALDVVIAVPDHGTLDTDATALSAAVGGVTAESVIELAGRARTGWAIEARRGQQPTLFRVAQRSAPHHRHWHKYAEGELSHERRFWFRSSSAHATGASAKNIEELAEELRRCEPAVIRHHAWHGDFSTWAAGVLADRDLAAAMKDAEDAIRGTPHADTELVRERLLAAVTDRYLV